MKILISYLKKSIFFIKADKSEESFICFDVNS